LRWLLVDLDVDRKIISRWSLMKQGASVWTGFIWLSVGFSVGFL